MVNSFPYQGELDVIGSGGEKGSSYAAGKFAKRS